MPHEHFRRDPDRELDSERRSYRIELRLNDVDEGVALAVMEQLADFLASRGLGIGDNDEVRSVIALEPAERVDSVGDAFDLDSVLHLIVPREASKPGPPGGQWFSQN